MDSTLNYRQQLKAKADTVKIERTFFFNREKLTTVSVSVKLVLYNVSIELFWIYNI